jgi:hypothetical protein
MSLDWVYDWIFAALPSYGAVNILRSKQRMNIPAVPFITYGVVFLDASGFNKSVKRGDLYADPDYTGEPPTPIGTFTQTTQQDCPLQIQIDCYSPAGMTDLQTLIDTARSEEHESIFVGAKTALQNCGVIKNLDFLGDNDYRDRWQVSCDFLIAMTRDEVRRAILDWEIGLEIDGLVHEIITTIEA